MQGVSIITYDAGFVNVTDFRGIKGIFKYFLKLPGSYKASFDGLHLASGMYFYKLEVYDEGGLNDRYCISKKMILIK